MLIYVSDIPALRLRAMNVAMAAATQLLFNFVVARAVPNMLGTVGFNSYRRYLIFSSFCASMFVFTWFSVQETKGLSLEKMDELFGVTQSGEKKLEESRRASQPGTAFDRTDDTKGIEEVLVECV